MGHGGIRLSKAKPCGIGRRLAGCGWYMSMAVGLLLNWAVSPTWSVPPESTSAAAASATAPGSGESKSSGSGIAWPYLRRGEKLPIATSGGSTKAAAYREDVSARLRRRLEVCDRIKVLAIQTGDERLEAAASEVENLIWQWYLEEKTRARTGGRSLPSPSGTARPSTQEVWRGYSQPPGQLGSTGRGIGRQEADSGRAGPTSEEETRPKVSPAALELQHRLDRRDVYTIRGSAPGEARPENVPQEGSVWSGSRGRPGAGTLEGLP